MTRGSDAGTPGRALVLLLASGLAAGWLACGDAAQEPESAPAASEAAEPVASSDEAETASETADQLGDLADGSQAPAAGPDTDYWLLTEFDWGDEREVVYESTQFDPFYTCHRKNHGICALTQVMVDEELMLAQFHFNERDRLFQMVFLTPDLDPQQAEEHLARVWQVLRDYVTRHRGEPEEQAPLPELADLAPGPPTRTHLWRDEEVEVRLRVGRRTPDRYYVAAFISDPAQPEAREAQDRRIEADDQRLRNKEASEAEPAEAAPGEATPARP